MSHIKGKEKKELRKLSNRVKNLFAIHFTLYSYANAFFKIAERLAWG